MKRELGISPCVVLFENLAELQKTMDEYLEFHKQTVEKYRDRLGVLLRNGGINNGGSPAGQLLNQISVEGGQELVQSKKKDSKKKDSAEEKGWMVLESEESSIKIASPGSARSSNEVSVLFKAVEALNAKVTTLKISCNLISELPSRGVRADQRFLVIFKDGLPKQIIPTNESYASQAKFRYSDQFELAALQRF